MLLVDALYINDSGGKILLDYLIKQLVLEKVEIHFLLDERIRDKHPAIPISEITYLKAGLYSRYKFYKANKNTFTKVFCFGNLPPSVRLNAEVYTYFHQMLFLNIPKKTPLKQRVLLQLKTAVFGLLQKNTDFWMVQSELVKADFLNKFPLVSPKSILILPFYPSLPGNSIKISESKKNKFIYVSNAYVHKNHLRLIEAFKIFYDQYKTGKLTVTIGPEYSDLNSLIKSLNEEKYPIINAGYVDRNDLAALYNANEYLIYPSLTESFGLGLIEAMENGCKVIGADLPYTYAVCKPSIVFDPLSVNSIAHAFGEAISNKSQNTEQLLFDEIKKIIQILK